ncbi:MAG: type II toxin-antitoxin system PemK/MazF family toxin [Deltaproteobacteria bacterium]|nr:type II toxin-antitoxin system PemK/MazF family toxin [Deltaproteobacteria bacterium]
MKKGEIWEADLGGKAGKRPVLVLTRSQIIPYLSKIVVAEITTKGKGYPTQIDIHLSANLKKQSFVSSEALHTIPKDCLLRYLGDLPENLLKQVNEAIAFALDLS